MIWKYYADKAQIWPARKKKSFFFTFGKVFNRLKLSLFIFAIYVTLSANNKYKKQSISLIDVQIKFSLT